jgi:thioredoxin reductase (NADPH)
VMDEAIDLFVIGAGVAGMTAAQEAKQRGLSVALAEGMMFGGLVMNVNHLKPFPPGMAASGGDLAADMMTKAADLGVDLAMTPVTLLAPTPSGEIRIETAEGAHLARAVIVASGARLRKLGVPGEEEFEHRGVSHCADCDGPLYRGEQVLVIGGGDSALQEAETLAEFCSIVHLVHRGNSFSARPDFVGPVLANPRVSTYFETVVEAIEGTDSVDFVRLRNVRTGEERSLPCKGILAYIGLEANTDFLPPEIAKENGCIKVDEKLQTSLANIYAVGAVRAGYAGELTHAIDDANRAVDAVSVRLALIE